MGRAVWVVREDGSDEIVWWCMRFGLHSTTLGSVSPDATQSVAVLKIVDVMLYQSRLAIVSNADERVYSLLVVW